ncbi:MAG TPA: HAD-IA family hydrolase [Candidatus Cybelea sp.]|jgi:beta-phosphoglucomutase family hydrolase|nr:HAD-IA family hydrolase [Candidatus Cybelea sp.]
MNLTQPKALIFDCDGTLADTMPLHWRAWEMVTRRYGLDFPQDRFYQLGGVPAREILQMLSAEQNHPLDPIAVAKEKEAAYIPFLPEVYAIEPVARIARENAGKLPMAVASGGIREHVNKVLEHVGLRALFQAVVTSEDVQRQKPAPDIFLEAARRLGVPPQFCRAYEDTDLGLRAIRAAGMDAVDVRPLIQNARSS